MGELTFFLGFQIKHIKFGTFISEFKYCPKTLKKFIIDNLKEWQQHFILMLVKVENLLIKPSRHDIMHLSGPI